MVKNKASEERIQALVAELIAEEAKQEFQVFEGQSENINDIENAMVRIGDMVAREFGMQKLARLTPPNGGAPALSLVWPCGGAQGEASPPLRKTRCKSVA